MRSKVSNGGEIAPSTSPATLQGDIVVRTPDETVTLNVPLFAVVQ